MGNTASNGNNGHRTVAGSSSDQRPRSPKIHSRNHSNSPSPGLPHRSMRTKKRSLELPDLASLSLSPTPNQRGRQTKTPSIPIPIHPGPPNNFAAPDRPRLLRSTSDLVHPPSTHQPFPPPPRNNPPLFRGAPTARQQPPISARQQQAQQRIQELYNQSQHVPPPAILPPLSPAGEDPTSPGFVKETVKSSIPIALGVVEGAVVVAGDQGLLSPAMRDDPVLVSTKITWRGGGKTVVLARAGDDDWKGRTIMERESPTSLTFRTTVNLLPGTHHIRFLVDDQWRVADDLPTAVDDQGSLANYVALPLAYSSPPAPQPPTIVAPIPTSISINKGKPPIPGQSFWSAASQDDEDDDTDRRRHRSRAVPTPAPNVNPAINNAQWTSVLPPELIEAAKEEEVYLAANSDTSRTHVHGFVPAPNIPPAPGLPRHLDKLILNARVSPAVSAAGSVRSGTPGSGGAGTPVGSGQGRGGRRERREREREGDRRERERVKREGGGGGGRRGAGMPPAPPPSEAGGEEEYGEEAAAAAVVPLEPVIVEEAPEQKLTTLQDAVGPDSTVSTDEGILTPSGSGEAAVILPSASGSGSGSLNASPGPSQTTTALPAPPTTTTTPAPPPPTTKPSLPHPPSGSRAITIDTANMPGMTDDGSVLPVPSHVVLHHLSTSAIRNGVLAVGNTIRYRKKYLTTIYYKPT